VAYVPPPPTAVRIHSDNDRVSVGSDRTTVVIADDHQLVREGLRLLVSGAGDIEVVGEAGDAAGVMDALAGTRPDVLLLDINSAATRGSPRYRRSRRLSETAVVILTMQKDPAYARRALDAGAAGYGAGRKRPLTISSGQSAQPPRAAPTWSRSSARRCSSRTSTRERTR